MTGLPIILMIETKPNITFFIVVTIGFAKNLSHTIIKTIKIIIYYFKEFIN